MNKRWAALALCVAPLALVFLGTMHTDLHAEAPTPTVVLLRGTAPDEVTTEATARVRGELKAAGFDVAIFALTGGDARRDLETAGRELNPIAAFAIFVKPSSEGTALAEIWVSDRIRQKTIIQNAILTDRDRGRGAEILAVRAVELLKASLADVWTSTAKATAPVAASALAAGGSVTIAPIHEKATIARPAFASGIGIGLGAGIHEDFGAATTAWAPEALLSYGWPQGLSVRATFQGLGPASTFSAVGGSAKVEEQLAFVEAVKTWWPQAPVVPFVCAGAGMQHIHTTGTESSPYQERVSDDWSPLASLGIGIAIPLFAHLSLTTQARAVGVWPTVIQINHMDAARISAVSMLADGGVVAVIP